MSSARRSNWRWLGTFASDREAEVRRSGLQEHDAKAVGRPVGNIGLVLFNLSVLGVGGLFQVRRCDLGELAIIVLFDGLYEGQRVISLRSKECVPLRRHDIVAQQVFGVAGLDRDGDLSRVGFGRYRLLRGERQSVWVLPEQADASLILREDEVSSQILGDMGSFWARVVKDLHIVEIAFHEEPVLLRRGQLNCGRCARGLGVRFFSGELLTSFWAAMKADSRLASRMARSILSTRGCSWFRSAR